MQTIPYSIYIDKRPLKIAFLIDPKSELEVVDTIIQYNQGKWGGRYNPIIICDGKSITNEWWQFLLAYDPDVIKSMVPLSDEIIQRFETLLSPYHIDVPHRQQSSKASVHVQDEGLSILPTPENIALASRSFDGNANLVLFEVDKLKDAQLKRFICNNFGTYSHTLDIDRALSGNKVKSFNIDGNDSLALAFEHLSTFERFVYPIQVCSLPNYFSDIDTNNISDEAFTVIIGDSLEDMVFSWNRPLYIPGWKRNQLMQAWIPTRLANDNNIESGLKKWLQRATDPSGSTHERVNFISFSLNQKELERYADRLTKDLWFMKNVSSLSQIPTPNYRDNYPFLRLKEGMELHRAVGEEEQIVMKEPDVMEGVMGGEYWVADTYIQLKSDLFKNFVNKDWWYQLPNRNILAHQMFRKPSRISAKGLPSVIIKRGENELNINLLSNSAVLRSLLVVENFPAYTNDPRQKFASKPFYNVERSDKGRYLTGFLDIFDGLFNANHVLQEVYWRRMFDLLSAHDSGKDEQKEQEVINKLQKKPQEYFEKPEGIKWLANYTMQLAKSLTISNKELPFERFDEEAKKELEDYNALDKNKFEYDPEDVKDAVTDLMENEVLIAGIKSHCPKCGIANWHKFDDVSQFLDCFGCGNQFTLEAEAKWHYKLNHLVLSGHVYHGLTPVVLVLGQMLEESGTSFMIFPSLCLYNKGDEKPAGELDIICVQDGKFIIGEVKQSIGGFTPSDFEKMNKLAKLIHPDRVIFSSMSKAMNKTVREQIQKLKAELNPIGIEVEWYQLHGYVFKPSPVR
jgi:hypothetical protein